MANKTVVFNFTELYLQDSFKPLVCISPSARCVIFFKVTLTFLLNVLNLTDLVRRWSQLCFILADVLSNLDTFSCFL